LHDLQRDSQPIVNSIAEVMFFLAKDSTLS